MAPHDEAYRAVWVILFCSPCCEIFGCWSDDAIHTIASIGHLQGWHLGTHLSIRDTTSLPAIGHLDIEREHHTVDRGLASLFCRRGRADLNGLRCYLFFCFLFFVSYIHIFVFIVFKF